MKLLTHKVVWTLMALGVVDLSRSTGGYLACAVDLHGHQSLFWKILHGFHFGGHCQLSKSPTRSSQSKRCVSPPRLEPFALLMCCAHHSAI